MENMTGASNKPFDYMACGNALLVSDQPDWTKMFVAPGYGLACDPEDSESIASALRTLLEQPIKRTAMGQLGRERIINDWSYEKQFAPLLGIVEETARAAKIVSGTKQPVSQA